jgi:hypothetical protein
MSCARRWIRERHALHPMEFAPLCQLLPPDLVGVVNELLVQKAISNEKLMVARPAPLVAWLAEEHAAGLAARETLPVARDERVGETLDELFQAWRSWGMCLRSTFIFGKAGRLAGAG